MSDPERILRTSGAGGAFERALLSGIQVVAVPAQAKAEVWAGLAAAGLEAASLAAVSAQPSIWHGTLKALASSKALLLVPAVVAAVTVGALSVRGPSARPASPVQVSSPGRVLAAPRALPAELTVESLGLPEPSERAPAPPPLPFKDRLARESAQLTRARAELRAGNADAARATLSRMQVELGRRGALRQEREVLNIEALAAQGKQEAAERLARAFIAAHPESPHVESVRRFIAAH